MNVAHSLEPGVTRRLTRLQTMYNILKYCKTLWNNDTISICKNRNGTGFFFNLIMTSTVCTISCINVSYIVSNSAHNLRFICVANRKRFTSCLILIGTSRFPSIFMFVSQQGLEFVQNQEFLNLFIRAYIVLICTYQKSRDSLLNVPVQYVLRAFYEVLTE